MDTTGLHIRSAITLTPAYAAALPVAQVQPSGPNQRRTLTFVGDTVTFAGATFTDVDVVVVAREVTGSRIKLANSSVAVAAAANNGTPGTGTPGFALIVLCSRLAAQGATTAGGKGGEGKIGAPGDPHPPAPPPDPNEPFPKPGPAEPGNPGKRGGKGGPGGPGGPITVLCEQIVGGGSWESAGGPGGAGGQGGPGGPASSGTGPHPQGPQGPQGVTGDVPPSTFVTPGVIGHPALVQALRDRGVNGRLADSLARTARFRSGLGALEVAADRRAYSRELGFGDIHLDYRITMDATPLPVERDLELVPDVPTYVERSKVWRGKLATAIAGPGMSAGPADLGGVAGRLREVLDDMKGAGGSLPVIDSEAVERLELADKVRTEAANNILVLRDKILQEFPTASFTAGGHAFTGSEFSERVGRDLLDAAAALPTAPDLAVAPSLRNSGTGFGGQRLAALRANAMGLAGPQNDGPGGWRAALATRAVDLSKVRGELQAARGQAATPTVRAQFGILLELLDAVQAVLLGKLRSEQAQFTRDTASLRDKAVTVAKDTLDRLSDSAAPAEHATRQGDLVAATIVLMDLLGYHLAQERQAIKLFTVGTSVLAGTGSGNPFDPDPDPDGPGFVLDPDSFAGLVADPDRPLDARELGIDPTGPAGLLLPAIGAKDNSAAFDEYVERGTGLGLSSSGAAAAAGPSHLVEFGPGSPEFTRFVDAKKLWFDIPLADLAGPAGIGPHREVKVLGVEVQLDGVTGFSPDDVVPEMTVALVHSGVSEQRVLNAAGAHRLVQLPAEIEVTLSRDVSSDGAIFYRGATVVGAQPAKELFTTTVLPFNFGAYGRGVAAGWTLRVTGGDVSLDALTGISIRVLYGTVLPTGVASLASVSMDRAGLQAGSTAKATVRLTAPAPGGGFRVDLTTDDPAAVKLPGSVVVAAGASTATFAVTAIKPAPAVRLAARGHDGMARRTFVTVQSAAEATQVKAGGGKDTVNVLSYVPGSGTRAPAVYAGIALPRPAESQPADHGTLVRFTPAMKEQLRIDIGSEPRALVHDPARNALVVLAGLKVTVLDADTLQVRAQREVGFTATDLTVDPVAGLILVPQLGPGRVLVLSADDLSDRPTVPGVPSAYRIDHAPGTDRAFVAQSSKAGPVAGLTLLRRRPQGYVRAGSVEISPGLLLPQDVLVDPALGRVYVACQGNLGAGPPSVRVYSLGLQLLRDIPLPAPARGLAAVPRSGTVTVATDGGAIQVDTTTGAVGDKAVLPNRVPHSVAVDPTSGVAYVGDRRDGTVTVLPVPLALPSTEWS